MTAEEYDEIIKVICPRCAAGVPARQRTDTKEWVHDKVDVIGLSGVKRFEHSLCLANYFRVHFAKEIKNG